MIAARAPAEEVMKISGHTQISTFLRYLNPTGSSLERAAILLSAFSWFANHRLPGGRVRLSQAR